LETNQNKVADTKGLVHEQKNEILEPIDPKNHVANIENVKEQKSTQENFGEVDRLPLSTHWNFVQEKLNIPKVQMRSYSLDKKTYLGKKLELGSMLSLGVMFRNSKDYGNYYGFGLTGEHEIIPRLRIQLGVSMQRLAWKRSHNELLISNSVKNDSVHINFLPPAFDKNQLTISSVSRAYALRQTMLEVACQLKYFPTKNFYIGVTAIPVYFFEPQKTELSDSKNSPSRFEDQEDQEHLSSAFGFSLGFELPINHRINWQTEAMFKTYSSNSTTLAPFQTLGINSKIQIRL
jgi:hypothetical protein